MSTSAFVLLAAASALDFAGNFPTLGPSAATDVGSTVGKLLYVCGFGLLLAGLLLSRGRIAGSDRRVSDATDGAAPVVLGQGHLWSVFDNAPIWVSVKDLQGRYRYVNAPYASRLNLTPKDIIGRTSAEIHLHPVSELSKELDAKVLATGEALKHTHDFYVNDGKYDRSRLYTKFPINGPESGIVAIGSATFDATDMRLAELKRAESEARFRDFSELGSYLQWELDSELRYRWVNEHHKDIEKNRGTLIGRKLRDVFEIDPETNEDWRQLFERLESRDRFDHHEVSGKDVHGKHRHYLVSGLPLFEAGGDFDGYRCVASEISEMRYAERKLADAVESLPVGFMLFDSNGGLEIWNAKSEEFFPQPEYPFTKGATYETMLRNAVENGMIPSAEADSESWIESRLAAYRNPAGPLEFTNADGRVVAVYEHKTSDGGTVAVRIDISELRKAEREREIRERQFKMLLDSSPVGIAIVRGGEEGRLYTNESFYEIFGKEVDQRANPIADTWVDGERRRELIERLKYEDSIGPLVTRRRRADGTPFWCLSHHQKTEWIDGEIAFISWVLDINDRVEAERKALEANRMLSAFMEYAPCAILIRDMEDRYLMANGQAASMIGADPDEIVGQEVNEFFPQDSTEDQGSLKSEILKTGRSTTDIVRVGGRGDETYLERTLFPIKNERGDCIALGFFGFDVTVKVEALNLVAERERELKRIVDTIERVDEGILIRDPASRMIFANKAALHMRGLNPNGAVGDSYLTEQVRRVNPGLVDLVISTVRPSVEMHGHWMGEIPVVNADGQERLLDYRSWRMANGDVIAITTDITERKQAENQLVQVGKLATLGETAAGIIHELAQPLNIIRLSAEGSLLRISKKGADQDFQMQQFQRIEAQATRMAEIIEQIRMFSRKDTSAFVDFDPVQSVGLTADMIHPQLSSANIQFDVSLTETAIQAAGRPVQLEQVILNLLSNARDAIETFAQSEKSGPGFSGRIELGTEVSDDGKRLDIVVRDNGGGIPETAIEKLFEPFFTTKDPGRGTGLGLSISYQIVRNMLGELSARNVEGGAEFRLSIPCVPDMPRTKEMSAGMESDAASQSGGYKHMVLVADDEEQAAEVLCEHFRDQGYRVRRAPNGKVAFEMFLDDPADIVVTDLRMPVMNGRDLIARLRELDAELPVIVTTGDLGTTESLDPSYGGNRLALLRKPISLAELDNTVRSFLEI